MGVFYHTITMSFSKNILICVFFTSLVSATPTCDECTMAFSNLVTRLTGEQSLVEQMDLLKTLGCGVMESPEECNDLVDTWWPVMASILYPSLIVPQDLCAMAGSCTEDNLKDWTCEDCLGGVVMAAGYFESEESIQMAVWPPVAIPILAGTLRAQEVEICQEEVGVCI